MEEDERGSSAHRLLPLNGRTREQHLSAAILQINKYFTYKVPQITLVLMQHYIICWMIVICGWSSITGT